MAEKRRMDELRDLKKRYSEELACLLAADVAWFMSICLLGRTSWR